MSGEKVLPWKNENSNKVVDCELDPESQKYLSDKFRGTIQTEDITIKCGDSCKTKINPNGYVGIIDMQDPSIAPLNFETKDGAPIFYLLRHLHLDYFEQETRDSYFKFDPEKRIKLQEGNFFEFLGRIFVDELNHILETEGLLKRYVRKEENIRFLKGKICLKEQIRKNYVNKTKFYCMYDDLTLDNLENQIILRALHLLKSVVETKQLIEDIGRLEIILKDFISQKDADLTCFDKIQYSRLNDRYQDILLYSRLIFEEVYIHSSSGDESYGFNFVVKAWKLYEDFISDIIESEARDKGYTVKRQGNLDNLNPEGEITLKPDITVENNEGRKHIIDAKYKLIDNNPDYYQVICYLLSVEKPGLGFLVYPEGVETSVKEKPLTIIKNVDAEEAEKKKFLKIQVVTLNLKPEQEKQTYEDYINTVRKSIRKKIIVEIEKDTVGYP